MTGPAPFGSRGRGIVTLTLNPSLDIKMIVRDPRLGELNRAERVYVEASGKGVNVSRALAALGVRSCAVVPLGGPFGAELRSSLAALPFDLEAVPIAGETRANAKVIDARDGRLTEFNAAGPELSEAERAAVRAALEARATRGGVAVLSGSLPPGTPPDAYAGLVARLRALGVRCVVDAGGASLAETLPLRPAVVKPNRREAEELLGSAIVTLGDAVAAARELQARGARLVALTLDRAGALLATAERTALALAPSVRVHNVNGAGDAFVAGLVAELTRAPAPGSSGADAPTERSLASLARRAVATGTARAAAPGGAFGDAAAVARMEGLTVGYTLEPERPEALGALPLETLKAETLETVTGLRPMGTEGSAP